MSQVKTPYSVVIFHKDSSIAPIKFPFVQSIFYTHNYLRGRNKRGFLYDYWYMNIYNRKTGAYIRRQYHDDFIVDKPAL